jgi:hypothetical protein
MAGAMTSLLAGNCAAHYDHRYLNDVKNLNDVKIFLANPR